MDNSIDNLNRFSQEPQFVPLAVGPDELIPHIQHVIQEIDAVLINISKKLAGGQSSFATSLFKKFFGESKQLYSDRNLNNHNRSSTTEILKQIMHLPYMYSTGSINHEIVKDETISIEKRQS